MLVFKDPRDSFELNYFIECVDCFLDETTGFNGGRNFLFGGESSLCPWPTPQPTEVLWDTCSGAEYLLEIENSEILANNLGGVGPNSDDEPVLRYAAVTERAGRAVDLVISVQEDQPYAVADNYADYQGIWEQFGQVNIRDDSTAHLTFTFVDAETDEPVELEKFYITFFDIDQQRSLNRHRERLCVDDDEYFDYVLTDATTLEVEKQDTTCDGRASGTSTVFVSTAAGFECDNPTDPLNLGTVLCEDCQQCVDQEFDEYFPIDQASRSVMLAYRNPISSFDISYEIPCVDCFLDETTGFNGGRNFLFGGISSLCSWPTPAPTFVGDSWSTCELADYELNIEGAPLIYNNLGGVGPIFDDPEVLRYGSVTEKDGRPVDVEISVLPGTVYETADNYDEYQGKWELFGQVNVRDNSTASLSLSFKDGYDDDFVELEKFYLSFFDIDQQRTENRHTESLCIDDDQFDEYLLSSTTSELQVTQQLHKCDGSYGSSTVFASSAAGFECDNPTDPLDLGVVPCSQCQQCVDQGFDEFFPIDQRERSVMFVFREPRSSIQIHYEIPCVDCFLDATTGFNGGRNFLFGGASSLCSWPTPAPTLAADLWTTCYDTEYELAIEGAPIVYNNLGGVGPTLDDPEVLRYGGVTTQGLTVVDLEISVIEDTVYAVADNYEEYQGKWELFGQVNVQDNSTSSLRFAFVSAETDEPVELDRFYLTFFDIDEQRSDVRHKEELCLDEDQFDDYVLANASELVVETREYDCSGSYRKGSTVFKSSRAGFECDNPTDPLDLGTIECDDCDQCVEQDLGEFFPIEQESRSVMLVFDAPRDAFEVHYHIPCVDCFLDATSGFNGGRNFLFGGKSSLCAWPTDTQCYTLVSEFLCDGNAPTCDWDGARCLTVCAALDGEAACDAQEGCAWDGAACRDACDEYDDEAAACDAQAACAYDALAGCEAVSLAPTVSVAPSPSPTVNATSSAPTDGLISSAGTNEPPAVLVAGLDIPACPLFVVVLSGVAVGAVALARNARRPMSDKVLQSARVHAGLVYGVFDAGMDCGFMCEQFHRENNRAFFWASLFVALAHSLGCAALLLRAVRGAKRRGLFDDALMDKHRGTFAAILVFATTHKMELAMLLPWKRARGHEVYDLQRRDGSVEMRVRGERMRHHKSAKKQAEKRAAEALPAVTTQDLLGFEDHEAELKKGGAPPAADASSANPLASNKTPKTYLRDVYGSTPKGRSAPEPATYEPLGDGAGEEDPLAAPLARGCRVEVRYAGSDDIWYPGHVAGVGVYGLYDVDYDHGETELCVARGRIRRIDAFTPGKVVDFEDADGFAEAKVVRHRGRAGRSVEKFGFPNTPVFVYAAASSLAGSVAQFFVKLMALLYGRRDAVTLVNACSNAAACCLVVFAIVALCRRRAKTKKQKRAPLFDTGMEAWALPDDDDDDYEIADEVGLKYFSSASTDKSLAISTISSMTASTARSSEDATASSNGDLADIKHVAIAVDFGDASPRGAGDDRLLSESNSGSHQTFDMHAGLPEGAVTPDDVTLRQSVSGMHTTLQDTLPTSDTVSTAASDAEKVTVNIFDADPSPAGGDGAHFPAASP